LKLYSRRHSLFYSRVRFNVKDMLVNLSALTILPMHTNLSYHINMVMVGSPDPLLQSMKGDEGDTIYDISAQGWLFVVCRSGPDISTLITIITVRCD